MRSCRASGSVAGACVLRLVVVADRPGALALGSPWHLARLDTWHVIVATVLPWNLPARLVSSRRVSSMRVLAVLVLLLVCVGRVCLWVATLAPDSTWHLRLGTPVELSSCTDALQAHIHCRHTCIAAHLWADAWDAVGHVPRPARAGLGWALPLNGCSQGLVVRGIIPPCTLSYICHMKSYQRCQTVYQSINISLLPRLTARSQADG